MHALMISKLTETYRWTPHQLNTWYILNIEFCEFLLKKYVKLITCILSNLREKFKIPLLIEKALTNCERSRKYSWITGGKLPFGISGRPHWGQLNARTLLLLTTSLKWPLKHSLHIKWLQSGITIICRWRRLKSMNIEWCIWYLILFIIIHTNRTITWNMFLLEHRLNQSSIQRYFRQRSTHRYYWG